MVPYRLPNKTLISIPGEYDNWMSVSSWVSSKGLHLCRNFKCEEYSDTNYCITCTMTSLSTDDSHVEYLLSSPTWRPLFFRLRTNLLMVSNELNPNFVKEFFTWRIAKLPLLTEASRISTFSLVHTDGRPYYPGYAAYQSIQAMLKFLYLSSAQDRLLSIAHMWNSHQYWKLAYDERQLYYQQNVPEGKKVADTIGGAPQDRMWSIK